MKRKLDSDEDLDKDVNCGDVDEFRDQILEQELSSKGENDETGASEEFVRVIKLRGTLSNLALPQDWVGMYHKSGGIIYLNRKTRVCTWARPYHLGKGSVRKHDVPTVAIPCLHHIMALKEHKKRRPCDIHDGNINHHVGNLDNQCGDHGNHLGNQGKVGEYPTKIADGEEFDDDLMASGDHGENDSNHGNTDGTQGSGASHANTDSTHDVDSNCDITAENTDMTHDGNMSIHTDHDMIDITRNKTISSLKAMENCDSDSNSDSGNNPRPENSKPTSQLEMLSGQEISDYLGRLWDFQEISKEEERKLVLTDSNDPPQNSTQVCKSAQLLKTIPYLVQGTDPKSKNNEKLVINPAGKSARSLLHEYCLKVLNVKPEYTAKESGVPKTPFLSTVEVDGLLYGSGMAATKKQAKNLAAQRTLEIFIPGSFKKLINVEERLKVFDTIPIEDPNVYELTSKLGLLSPYQVLKECIKRNQGVLTSELKFELNQGTDKKLYYTMECGKHKATGTCPSKKYGRELAAQSLLKKLHPHLNCWGSVLRIYVDQHTAQEFTKPEEPAPATLSVNKELLSDLKHEMWKLMKKKKETPTAFISKSFTDIDI